MNIKYLLIVKGCSGELIKHHFYLSDDFHYLCLALDEYDGYKGYDIKTYEVVVQGGLIFKSSFDVVNDKICNQMTHYELHERSV